MVKGFRGALWSVKRGSRFSFEYASRGSLISFFFLLQKFKLVSPLSTEFAGADFCPGPEFVPKRWSDTERSRLQMPVLIRLGLR